MNVCAYSKYRIPVESIKKIINKVDKHNEFVKSVVKMEINTSAEDVVNSIYTSLLNLRSFIDGINCALGGNYFQLRENQCIAQYFNVNLIDHNMYTYNLFIK